MGMALIASMNSWTLFLVIIAFILAIQHSIEKTEHLTSHRVGTLVGAILLVILILPTLAIPFDIYQTNSLFAQTFPARWNQIPANIQAQMLQTPYISSVNYFGGDFGQNFEAIHGLIYVNTSHYQLYYDVYYPRSPNFGDNRTIIYLHGGSWVGGSRSEDVRLLEYLASEGYIVFAIDYRLVAIQDLDLAAEIDLQIPIDLAINSNNAYLEGSYTINDMISDIGNLTFALSDHIAVQYGANLNNVTLIGEDAGAYFAGLMGFGYHQSWFAGNFSQSLTISSIILYYPPNNASEFFYDQPLYHDNLQMIPGDPVGDASNYWFDTPSNLIDSTTPACLIFDGSFDSLVPIQNSNEINSRFAFFNRTCIQVPIHLIGHGFAQNPQYQSFDLYYIEQFLYFI